MKIISEGRGATSLVLLIVCLSLAACSSDRDDEEPPSRSGSQDSLATGDKSNEGCDPDLLNQSLYDLRGITCDEALKVIRDYEKVSSDAIEKSKNEKDFSNPLVRGAPNCRGEGSFLWRGWRLTGVGTVVQATKFSQGDQSFELGGGGGC